MNYVPMPILIQRRMLGFKFNVPSTHAKKCVLCTTGPVFSHAVSEVLPTAPRHHFLSIQKLIYLAMKVIITIVINYLLKDVWHTLNPLVDVLLRQFLPSFTPKFLRLLKAVLIKIILFCKVYPLPTPSMLYRIDIW